MVKYLTWSVTRYLRVQTGLINKPKIRFLFVLTIFIASVPQPAFGQTIVYPEDGSLQELIAAKEVCRYIYLRTGQKLPLKKITSIPETGDLILIAEDDNKMVESLTDPLNHKTNPGGFIIKTVQMNSRQIFIITGYDPIATLYGAYRFAEHLGMGFGLIRDKLGRASTPHSMG
jgi:alpha-glucuronidase